MPYLTGIPDTMSTDSGGSRWDVREEPDAVYVRNSRVPHGEELRFTRDEWSELLQVIAAGGLPPYAEELGSGHVVKIAPPGRDKDALFFWLDEMGAFTHDVRTGKYGPIPASARSGVDQQATDPRWRS
ncbi:DUF397 domain-containing protein [Asanoa iriomotensis]|uniref:DUF397 domain-containing protein n=1 Tax=Asanoa iriomotensis TaxID=234613 RepID=A0ABQ4C5S6_9ACTN|nr:DUF397 domain-containing protein [Asanoa iriomotensis]GIF57625.1 hypothetical protein Air01nite_37200 [Asanoa iriomotensis]